MHEQPFVYPRRRLLVIPRSQGGVRVEQGLGTTMNNREAVAKHEKSSGNANSLTTSSSQIGNNIHISTSSIESIVNASSHYCRPNMPSRNDAVMSTLSTVSTSTLSPSPELSISFKLASDASGANPMIITD
jgi:hypothetical protein